MEKIKKTLASENILLKELQNNRIPVSKHCEKGKETWGNIVENIDFTPLGSPITLPEGMRLWEYSQKQNER